MTHPANTASNWSAPTITFEAPRAHAPRVGRVPFTRESLLHLDVMLPLIAAFIVLLLFLAWVP